MVRTGRKNRAKTIKGLATYSSIYLTKKKKRNNRSITNYPSPFFNFFFSPQIPESRMAFYRTRSLWMKRDRGEYKPLMLERFT